MRQRNRNLDIAKGICMICMILVHMFSWWGNAYPNFNKYTGVFFLVFFFFASGVCFKAVPWKDYVIKRFKRLLLPYYILRDLCRLSMGDPGAVQWNEFAAPTLCDCGQYH